MALNIYFVVNDIRKFMSLILSIQSVDNLNLDFACFN
jgi:hypothetical protein